MNSSSKLIQEGQGRTSACFGSSVSGLESQSELGPKAAAVPWKDYAVGAERRQSSNSPADIDVDTTELIPSPILFSFRTVPHQVKFSSETNPNFCKLSRSITSVKLISDSSYLNALMLRMFLYCNTLSVCFCIVPLS